MLSSRCVPIGTRRAVEPRVGTAFAHPVNAAPMAKPAQPVHIHQEPGFIRHLGNIRAPGRECDPLNSMHRFERNRTRHNAAWREGHGWTARCAHTPYVPPVCRKCSRPHETVRSFVERPGPLVTPTPRTGCSPNPGWRFQTAQSSLTLPSGAVPVTSGPRQMREEHLRQGRGCCRLRTWVL